jgi:hypothetical protein
MKTLNQFKAARRVSVPLIVWKTPDPAATIAQVVELANGKGAPVAQWDCVRGMKPLNEQAQGKVSGEIAIGNPVDALIYMESLDEKSILFFHNAHKFTADPGTLQAVWNLRDSNKQAGKTLVLLAPSMPIPPELANDVLVLDEALPDEAQLTEIVLQQFESAELPKPGDKETKKAVDAISGLSAFSAEQVVAMSFEGKTGSVKLNHGSLWERKRQAVEETRGLKVWRGGETFNDIGGVQNIKDFLALFIGGRKPPHAIVWVDELEKSLAGAQGDTSGTSQDQLGVFLKEMEDNAAEGVLFVGHPGGAKSMVAKATGNTAQVPTIAMDLGAMKGSLVGESEANIRAAMSALYIATCNKIGVIPPELQRRFTLGTFFFDLPSKEERETIWKLYTSKFELSGEAAKRPEDDEGWTGADIFNCAKRAWMFRTSLAEAAKYASPICKTRPKEIEALRDVANNAFISASYPGLYKKGFVPIEKPGKRQINMAN